MPDGTERYTINEYNTVTQRKKTLAGYSASKLYTAVSGQPGKYYTTTSNTIDIIDPTRYRERYPVCC